MLRSRGGAIDGDSSDDSDVQLAQPRVHLSSAAALLDESDEDRGVGEQEDVMVGASGDGASGVRAHSTGGASSGALASRGALAIPQSFFEYYDYDGSATRDAVLEGYGD